MFPRLLTLGHFSLPTYGVLMATAYLVAIAWARRKSVARGLSPDDVADLGVTILLSSLIGSKLLLFALTPREFLSWGGLIRLLQAGGVFYGGLVTATVVGLWMLKRRGLPLWETADLMAPSIALGESIGRIGCLAAGCCWGKPTDVPWAIVFTNPLTHDTIGTPLEIGLHPTQVYLSLDALLLFVVLEALDRSAGRFPGRTFWVYVFLHAIFRGVIEIYRGDTVRGFLVDGLLSTSQAIGAVTATLALGMLVVLARRARVAQVRGA